MRKIICIDIGGTSCKFGVVNEAAEVLEKTRIENGNVFDFDDFFHPILQKIDHTIKAHDVFGISLSCPGAVVDGVVLGTSNIPCLYQRDVKRFLSDRYCLPVAVENDANCAAIGEFSFGNGRGYHSILSLVIGTGIGGGIILDGQLYRGHGGFGGEVGHMIFVNDHGQWNNYHDFASVGGVIKAVSLAKGTNGKTMSGKEIFDSVENDEVCKFYVGRFYDYLAMLVYNCEHALAVDAVLIGGEISLRSELIVQIKQRLANYSDQFKTNINHHVLTCKFNNDANLIGAMANLLREVKS